ncbi:hypothetical protein E1A91_A10G220200v1 [Gossypium mustelinum]|uniref:Uncharacterized protein n=2 Tax=Gossypium TaxID=3633 RepID=A0A5D2XQ39_GOSMU|nr:hypothetical protein ES288_A10G242300v1 [Gossypium darwinii]TYH00030.1 hypothetical protein ES288_A10G242300v1 [Gossypium darwinii]TYJ15986.1 hypothetical protein E1A91_A10G220200v1 [Gossypium mustelinum]TYJ15987.1 hypothetical protein E1A91_A10G220200v1 [Gossypium mustelinum]TYJ15988.1 hypothetical protein E1A91_A10G220200v1 [Gossypium mustelinum]
MNYQSFHRVQNLFYLVLGIFIFSSFYRHLVTRFVGFLSFCIMDNASHSTQMSWKPISSAIVSACRHALASAVTRSGIFSHEKCNL